MKQSKIYSTPLAWCAPLLLTALVAACGGGGRDPILGTGDIAPVFTPGSIVDTTAPRVIATSVYPNGSTTSGATGLAINRNSTATFSEDMNSATICGAASLTAACPTATFTLIETVSTTPVAGAVTYLNRTATFNPTANLTPDTLYTSSIKVGAKDVAGNSVSSNYVWNWRTAAAVAALDTTPPTVTLTYPADAATNVATNSLITASFSEEMQQSTLIAANFKVNETVSNAVVAGSMAYDAQQHTAIFTPQSSLTANTDYTVSIGAGATDLANNALVVPAVLGMPKPNPWHFKTASVVPPIAPPVAINLGAIGSFGTFGGSAGMTNSGLLTVVNGDIGTTAVSTAVTGFHDAGPGCTYTETPLNKGTVNGLIYTAAPPPTVACPTEGTATTFAIATQARADALAAYNALVAKPVGANPGANLAGKTLAPGVYTAPSGSFMIQGGDLTLDAQGDANAVWVFQMATTLTVGGPGAAAPQSIILAGGAQAKNVFWQVGSAATINAGGGGTMVGTIIAQQGAAFSTAGNVAIVTLQGRAISLNASVTLVNTVINVPQ